MAFLFCHDYIFLKSNSFTFFAMLSQFKDYNTYKYTMEVLPGPAEAKGGPIHCIIYCLILLTHWGRVTHICVSKLNIIGSDNGLSPGRRQAIIWTNAGILLIGPLGTSFHEISIDIPIFSFKKMHLKMLSGKWRPFCPGPNVLIMQCGSKHRWCEQK